jgi:hypothetical protein
LDNAGNARGRARDRLTRRDVLGGAGLLAAFAALTPELLRTCGWRVAAEADAALDALNGLVAFVVPGPDPYSVAQGVSTVEPGGIAAGTTAALVATLDRLQPAPPPFPTLSAAVAAVLDGVAGQAFATPFAALTFAQKAAVFAGIEGDPSLAPLAGALLALVAFLAYSEAGVFDPAARAPTDQPVGWAITGYPGVADGRADLKGYYQDRRQAS